MRSSKLTPAILIVLVATTAATKLTDKTVDSIWALFSPCSPCVQNGSQPIAGSYDPYAGAYDPYVGSYDPYQKLTFYTEPIAPNSTTATYSDFPTANKQSKNK